MTIDVSIPDPTGQAKVPNIVLWPVVETQLQLSEVYWRTAWQCAPLLAAGQKIQIFFAGTSDTTPPLPAWLSRPNGEHWPIIKLVDSKSQQKIPTQIGRVIVWDRQALVSGKFAPDQDVVLGDDDFDVEAPDRILTAVTRWTVGTHDQRVSNDHSIAALSKFKRDDVIIVGPGAKVRTELDCALQKFPNALKIGLATSILIDGLYDHFAPDIVVALDAAGQLGPCSSAEEFRTKLCKFLASSKTVLVTSARNSAPFLASLPDQARQRVVVLEQIDRRSSQFKDAFDKGAPAIWDTGNILTALALPLACFLAQRVIFAGITLAPNINSQAKLTGYWSHADPISRERRHAAMLIAHPLFGLDASHSYLARHVTALNEAQSIMGGRGIGFYSHDGQAILVDPTAAGVQLSDRKSGVPFTNNVYHAARWVLDRPRLTAIGVTGIVYTWLAIMSLWRLELMSSILISCGFGLVFLGLAGLTLHIRCQNARILRLLNQQSRRKFENLNARLEALEKQDKPNLRP